MMPRPYHCRSSSCGTLLLILWAVVLVNSGCGRGLKRPLVHPVKGRVTLDGQPIEGVGLSLRPVVTGQGLSAFGKTLADGSYSLSSTGGGKLGAGAVAGDYFVMLEKFVSVSPDAVPPQFAPATADPSRKVQQWFSRRESITTDADGNKERQIFLGVLPEAYAEAETSGLRVTVKPGKNSGPEFEFHLRRDFHGAKPNAEPNDQPSNAAPAKTPQE
jgi:hypothetical protein